MNVFSSLCDGVETISDEIGMLCFFPFLKTSKIKRKLMVPLSNLSPLELYPFDWFYRLIDVIEAIGELTLIRYHSIGYVFFSGFRWSFRQIDVGIFHLPVTLV